MAKSTRNSGKRWSSADKAKLRQLARENTPTRVAGLKPRRPGGRLHRDVAIEGIRC